MLLLIFLLLVLVLLLPAWPYSVGWGYYPSGLLALLILVILLLAFADRRGGLLRR